MSFGVFVSYTRVRVCVWQASKTPSGHPQNPPPPHTHTISCSSVLVSRLCLSTSRSRPCLRQAGQRKAPRVLRANSRWMQVSQLYCCGGWLWWRGGVVSVVGCRVRPGPSGLGYHYRHRTPPPTPSSPPPTHTPPPKNAQVVPAGGVDAEAPAAQIVEGVLPLLAGRAPHRQPVVVVDDCGFVGGLLRRRGGHVDGCCVAGFDRGAQGSEQAGASTIDRRCCLVPWVVQGFALARARCLSAYRVGVGWDGHAKAGQTDDGGAAMDRWGWLAWGGRAACAYRPRP